MVQPHFKLFFGSLRFASRAGISPLTFSIQAFVDWYMYRMIDHWRLGGRRHHRDYSLHQRSAGKDAAVRMSKRSVFTV